MAGENCNLNKDEAEILKPSSPSSSKTPPTSSSPPPSLFLKPSAPEFSVPERPQIVEKPVTEVVEAAVETDASSSRPKPADDSQQPTEPVRFSNRCSCCKKKVGLTGFRCRCGDLFCGRHRYSDAHDCTFDYKTAGREQISKANPLIRAAKIIKI